MPKNIILIKNRINKLQTINKMAAYCASTLNTQNDLLMKNLMDFYNDHGNLRKMMSIINGESKISLRIVDWFVTNFAKKNYTVYDLPIQRGTGQSIIRFKVYNDYKLKLKAYSKKRFDPFCRWERINVPFDDEKFMETTIGQLNFFKWAIENKIVDYIENNYTDIEDDMNHRNSTAKRHSPNAHETESETDNTKTRKKREELSVSACKCIKKETVQIIVKFN
jgi:hypothetical protein